MARRTAFFANMVNFLGNYDIGTGKISPYYEPLDDDLILNMPLPCSQAAWLACDEESWRLEMESHPPSVNYLSSDLDQPGSDALSRQTCLKFIVSKFSKERLETEVGAPVGLGDSDEFRRLIILCASVQFA